MHKAALVTILATAISGFACSEETKVKVLKHKLRRAKLEDPRNTLPVKNFDIEIPRADDLKALSRALPTTLMSPWVVVGNPGGYGQSFLVKKFGFSRDELYKQHLYPTSGPVLFIDFRDCSTAADAKIRLVRLIDQYSLAALLPFYKLGTLNQDAIYYTKLRLFRRACRELSDEGHPVIFIMDSVSTLVTQALSGQPSERSQLAAFICTLFNFNEVLIPVPMASSAATKADLHRVSGHVSVRTVTHYPNFVSDPAILHEHVRALCAMHGVAATDEEVAAAVSFYGGCLSAYRVLCMKAKTGMPLAKVLAMEMKSHSASLLQLLHLTTDVPSTGSLQEKAIALSCIEVLEILLRDEGSITDTEEGTLSSYEHPAVHRLLSCHTSMLPVLGLDPTTERVTFAIPGTRAILSEPDTVKAIARLRAEVRWKVS